jgi:spore germination protein GerM
MSVPFAGGARPHLLPRVLLCGAIVGAGLGVRSLPTTQFSLSGWWPWPAHPIVTLFFAEGRYLFPVSRRIPPAEDPSRATLEALLAGPGPATGLSSAIPKGVEIRSFARQGDVVQIDLSADLLDEGIDLEMARSAIVETMTTVPGIRSVAVSVEGKTLGKPATRMPLQYFASANGLVAVPASASTPRATVDAFLAGPPDTELTGLPRDVRLLRYESESTEGLVSLNFTYTESVRTLAIEKPERMRFVLLGLIATLTELRDVRKVQIDFEGQTRLGLGQCSDLLRIPQPRPQLLNDERLLGR